jgi:hypothetical protein
MYMAAECTCPLNLTKVIRERALLRYARRGKRDAGNKNMYAVQ